MLRNAANQWPDDKDNARVLMLRLMEEGDRALRERTLAEAYESAFTEWDGSEDAVFWDSFSGDGLNSDVQDAGK